MTHLFRLLVMTLATSGPMATASGALAEPVRLAQSSEVSVPQVSGRIPAKAAGPVVPRVQAPPEGAAQQALENSAPDRPITCTSANASSPACYSATQQARPVGR